MNFKVVNKKIIIYFSRINDYTKNIKSFKKDFK